MNDIRRIIVPIFAMLIAACGTNQIKPVKNVSDNLGPDTALVAFSVSSAEPYAIQRMELVARGEPKETATPRTIAVRQGNRNEQVFVYSVPAGGARFGQVRFLIQGEWWETTDDGPEFSATPGQLTYLGRIQLESIKIGRYVDSGRRFPSGAKIGVLDAGEDDLTLLALQFALPLNMPVNKFIAGAWGDSEFTALDYQPIPGRDGRYNHWYWDVGPTGPAPPATQRPRP